MKILIMPREEIDSNNHVNLILRKAKYHHMTRKRRSKQTKPNLKKHLITRKSANKHY